MQRCLLWRRSIINNPPQQKHNTTQALSPTQTFIQHVSVHRSPARMENGQKGSNVKPYSLHDYRTEVLPCNISPHIVSPFSMFPNDLCPPSQPLVTSAPVGDGTVPSNDNLPLGDFDIDAIINNLDGPSLPIDSYLPTPPAEPVQPSLDTSQPQGMEVVPPCLPPTQSIAPHQQPVQPLSLSLANDYGDIPAMKEAILGLAHVVCFSRINIPGTHSTVVTARSANGQLVTVAVIVVYPAAGKWTKVLGGEQYFPTYREAMGHILALLEQRMYWMLQYQA